MQPILHSPLSRARTDSKCSLILAGFQRCDDDVMTKSSFWYRIQILPHTVDTFSSDEEFLRSAHLNDTSCVIANVQIPVMNGVELLTLMRTPGYVVRLIFITSR